MSKVKEAIENMRRKIMPKSKVVENEEIKEPEETPETPETNEVSTPEDLEAIKAQFEEEKQAKAAAEAALTEKDAVEKEITRDGLPKEAFAIVGDPEDPETWKLPHHNKAIFKALRSRFDIEKTVSWYRMPAAVAALSRGGYRGERVQASEEDIIQAARHLARHYEKAGKSVPDTLGALI